MDVRGNEVRFDDLAWRSLADENGKQIDERRALAIGRLSREVDQIRAFRRIREEDPPLALVEEMIDEMKGE